MQLSRRRSELDVFFEKSQLRIRVKYRSIVMTVKHLHTGQQLQYYNYCSYFPTKICIIRVLLCTKTTPNSRWKNRLFWILMISFIYFYTLADQYFKLLAEIQKIISASRKKNTVKKKPTIINTSD